MAYTQALQSWVEKANLPMPGQPCLLWGSVLELHNMMEQYVYFSDDSVLGSVALSEGFFGSQTPISTDTPNTLPASTDIPSEETAMEEVSPIGGPLEEPTTTWVPHEKQAKMEVPPNQFPSYKKYYIPLSCSPPWGKFH